MADERKQIGIDYELHGEYRHVLVTDRAIGFFPEDAKPDGGVYVFVSPDWACPTVKLPPGEARKLAKALIRMAEAVEQ